VLSNFTASTGPFLPGRPDNAFVGTGVGAADVAGALGLVEGVALPPPHAAADTARAAAPRTTSSGLSLTADPALGTMCFTATG